MPMIKMIAGGLTAAGARQSAMAESGASKYDLKALDEHGEEVVITATDEMSKRRAFSEFVQGKEKDALLAKIDQGQLSGPIRDTRGRYGDPREWDHFALVFSREEAANYGAETREKMAEIVAKGFNTAPKGKDGKDGFDDSVKDGRRLTFMTRSHDDTGNVHYHYFVHRHAINPDLKTVSNTIDLNKNNLGAIQAQHINDLLREGNLPLLTDFHNMRGSCIDFGAAFAADAIAAGEEVIAAGGVPTKNFETGIPDQPAGDQPLVSRVAQLIDPDAERIKSLIYNNEKALVKLKNESAKIANDITIAQNALAAIELKNQAIAERNEARMERDQALEDLKTVSGERDEAQQREQAVSERAMALASELEEVKAALTEAQGETASQNEIILQQEETIGRIEANNGELQAKVTEQASEIEALTQKVGATESELANARAEAAKAVEERTQALRLVEQKDGIITGKDHLIGQQAEQIQQAQEMLRGQAETIQTQRQLIADNKAELDQQRETIASQKAELEAQQKTMAEQAQSFNELRASIEANLAAARHDAELNRRELVALRNESKRPGVVWVDSDHTAYMSREGNVWAMDSSGDFSYDSEATMDLKHNSPDAYAKYVEQAGGRVTEPVKGEESEAKEKAPVTEPKSERLSKIGEKMEKKAKAIKDEPKPAPSTDMGPKPKK